MFDLFFHNLYYFFTLLMEQITIKAASLNFSGINNNYFQYNDGSPFFEKLNQNFTLIRDQQFPEIKEWKGAGLDKNYKHFRFTALSGDDLASKITDKLFSEQQFKNNWKKTYANAKAGGKIDKGYEAKPQQEKDVEIMDYCFYRAIVMALYDFKTLEQYSSGYGQVDPKKLKDFLGTFRDSPRFQLSYKQKLVTHFYQTMDVMFLQEANPLGMQWKISRQYRKVCNNDSYIFFKANVFGEINEKQTKKWQNLFNINGDTVVVITTNKYLLISSHFKSTAPAFNQQEDQLFRALNSYLEYYSKDNQEMKIIIGADVNHYIPTLRPLKTQAYIFPSDEKQYTTHKKRSFIQAQLKKAGVGVNEVKDHILTTLKINESYVSLINGKKYQNELLPNDQHPYDHFVVTTFLTNPSPK